MQRVQGNVSPNSVHLPENTVTRMSWTEVTQWTGIFLHLANVNMCWKDRTDRTCIVKVTLITSATKSEGGYVFTPFCLFVCLCAGHLKKLQTDLDEMLWKGWFCDKDERIRFR